MGVEKFYNFYPATSELPRIVRVEQTALKDFNSPLSYIAGRLMKSGHEGVKEVNDRLVKEYGLDYSDKSGAVIFSESKEDSAAVLFGSTIQILEDSFTTGEFDNDSWIKLVNFHISGTLIRDFELDESLPKKEVLTAEKLGEMRAARLKDPTLSIFFRNPDLLPISIRVFLQTKGFLSFVKGLNLIDEWEKRAKVLLSAVADVPPPQYQREIDEILQSLDF